MTRKKDEEPTEIPGGKAAERLREFISGRFPGETALPDQDATNPEKPKNKDDERQETGAKKQENEKNPPED